MALYLTYRPKTFDEVLGQDHVISILKPKVMSNDNAHNNYIFYGPRGTGKTSTARIFAKALNCLDLQNGNPCNTCTNCQLINTNRALDVVEIDAASHTGVDNVREEIIEKAPYPPAQLKKKVYIIDEVHMLSKPAFNALLKIMEEPPAYLVFILATTEIQKVPETIISRCQVFTLKKIPADSLAHHLEYICKNEWFGYTPEALMSIAKISDGCARDAVKYLDQVSILGDITQDHVSSFLGVASDQLVEQFLTALLAHDMPTAFTAIDTLHTSGIDMAHFIKQCLGYIADHFTENIGGYSEAVELCRRVNYAIKSFPLPAILLKAEVAQMCGASNDATPPAPIPAVKKTPTATTTTKSAPAPTPIAAPTPETSTNATSTDLTPQAVESQTDAPTKIATAPQWDSTDLLSSMAHHAQTPNSIRSILLNSCLLEQNDTDATLFIFNKLQGGMLQKADTRSLIENTYKELSGRSDGLKIVITTKEEYFANKL